MDWYQSQMLLAAAHMQQHPQLHPHAHPHFQSLAFGPSPLPPPGSHWATALNPKLYPQYLGFNGLSYLANQQEPPLLQNPERVIRLNECERFERSYQPNVALAPRQRLKEANGNSHHPQHNNNNNNNSINGHSNSSNGSVLVKVKQEPTESPNGVTTKAATKSPEQFSNEITSSTSPQPVANRQQQQNHVHPKPSPVDDYKENKAALSIFPVKTEPLHANDSSPPTTTTPTPAAILPPTKAALKQRPLANPEFELSTDDTDDESSTSGMSGNQQQEADSSQVLMAPLEAAHQLLKDAKPESLEKVLSIIKMLLHENWQQRHVCEENLRLQEELRRRDMQILELQSLLRAQEQQLLRVASNNQQNAVSSPNVTMVVKPEASPLPRGEEKVVCRVPSDSSSSSSSLSSNCSVNSGTAIKLKRKAILEMENSSFIEEDDLTDAKRTANENDKPSATNSSPGTTVTAITLPLKKSLRRSPEDHLESNGVEVEKVKEEEIATSKMAAIEDVGNVTDASSAPVMIQSKKHRIFLNKQRQEEEEEQKRRRSSVKEEAPRGEEEDVADDKKEKLEKDKRHCIVAVEKMDVDQLSVQNGDVEEMLLKSPSKKGSSTAVSVSASPLQQLQCAG